MKKYIRTSSKYEAIQFTGDNREKIMDALKLSKDDCKLWVNADSKDCYLSIHAMSIDLGLINRGEWILCTRTQDGYIGGYQVIPEVTFKDQFEELK